MLRICISADTLRDECLVVRRLPRLCLPQQHAGYLGTHRRLTGREQDLRQIRGVACTYKGLVLFHGLLIRCFKVGLSVLPCQDNFTDHTASCVYSAVLKFPPQKKENSQQKFS